MDESPSIIMTGNPYIRILDAFYTSFSPYILHQLPYGHLFRPLKSWRLNLWLSSTFCFSAQFPHRISWSKISHFLQKQRLESQKSSNSLFLNAYSNYLSIPCLNNCDSFCASILTFIRMSSIMKTHILMINFSWFYFCLGMAICWSDFFCGHKTVWILTLE